MDTLVFTISTTQYEAIYK